MALCCYTSKEVQIKHEHATKEERKMVAKHKIATQTILYEVFETEVDSYDDALDRMMPTIYDGTDDYPEEVKRVSWYYDHKDYKPEDRDTKGLIGIKIPEEEADKMSYSDFIDTDGCHLGDYREPTDKECEEDRAQAIADNREYAY